MVRESLNGVTRMTSLTLLIGGLRGHRVKGVKRVQREPEIMKSFRAGLSLQSSLELSGTFQRPQLLRPEEVARLLSCSRSQVYSLIKTGEIPSIRAGEAVRVPEAAFVSWLSGK